MLQVILVVQLGFVLGLSVLTLWYHRRHRLFLHILLAALSYTVLLSVTAQGIWIERIGLYTWQFWSLFVGYGLGDLALLRLTRKPDSEEERWRKVVEAQTRKLEELERQLRERWR